MCKKKNLAFFIAATGNISFAVGNIAIALNKYMKSDFDIVIFQSGFSDLDIAALSRIQNTNVREFNFPKAYIDGLVKKMPDNSRFKDMNKLMCLAHYEIFALLREYKNVVWLDADVSIQGDLSGILKYGPLGFTPDTPWLVRNQFAHYIDGYDMDMLGVCTAVIIVNDSLPYEEIFEFLYQATENNVSNVNNPDQAGICMMLERFRLKPTIMPRLIWQCMPYFDKASTAKIVHFGTETKVWNDSVLFSAFPEWFRRHLEWLDLGGSDFDRTKIQQINMVESMRGIQNSDNYTHHQSDAMMSYADSNQFDEMIKTLSVLCNRSIIKHEFKVLAKAVLCKLPQSVQKKIIDRWIKWKHRT